MILEALRQHIQKYVHLNMKVGIVKDRLKRFGDRSLACATYSIQQYDARSTGHYTTINSLCFCVYANRNNTSHTVFYIGHSSHDLSNLR